MRIGCYICCTVAFSFLSFAGFTAVMLPQWQVTDAAVIEVSGNLSADSTNKRTFPIEIADTPLVMETLAKYEGNQIENRNDIFLVDAAALALHNTGNRAILTAEIELDFLGNTMCFFASNIPADSHILLVEQSGAEWTSLQCSGYRAVIQYESENYDDECLRVTEIDDITLAVTNLTDLTKRDIWIYYKNYISEDALYVGGITYLYQINEISPGETVSISPERYVRGYSAVVKIVALGS